MANAGTFRGPVNLQTREPVPLPVNVSEFEAIARERMTPSAYDYYAGGAEDEVTLAENREAFRRLALRPRVLTGTETVSTRTTVLGLVPASPSRWPRRRSTSSGIPTANWPPRVRRAPPAR